MGEEKGARTKFKTVMSYLNASLFDFALYLSLALL